MVYEKDEDGNEKLIFKSNYYEYDTNENGENYYPKDANGNQFYMYHDTNLPIFININSKQIYAIDNLGKMIYPKSEYAEIYAINNPKPGFKEIYPIEENFDEIYAESDKNEFVYATTNYGIEIYAKDLNKNEFYATKHGKPYYAKNMKSGNEYYARDSSQNDIYIDTVFAKINLNNEYYALKEMEEIYPKDVNGKEIYAKRNFSEYYRKDKNNDEIYAKDENGEYYYAKNEYEDEIYARDNKLNEYYFNDNIFAKTSKGINKYAKLNTGKWVETSNPINPIQPQSLYILVNGIETYEKVGNKEVFKTNENIPIYAKSETGKEIYPLNENGKPYFIFNNNHEIYAKNEYGDEYYFHGDTNEVFALDKINNMYYLARSVNGEEYYPKNSEDWEFTFGPYMSDNIPYYPKDDYGDEMYPKDNEGNEYYMYDTNDQPSRDIEDSAGYDIYTPKNITINPNEQVDVDIGIILDMKGPQYTVLVKDKSSVAKNLQVATKAGVIDQGFRGSIRILLKNEGNNIVSFNAGDKICQILFIPIYTPTFREVEKIDVNTQRGKRGFGGEIC
ncbi:deoxyuridine 5'-triphosphate nucleotidohydrolase [Caerostris darwini]|uniref:dUTP diphosphatase n=1 Tax=Caerostris darwini TaxID=1538125 RepID=A0AAV4T7R0_9ARAC|nr:deoxyuridine 5'-triphosphate nucleotidohydrolase [Caerostris darwini]